MDAKKIVIIFSAVCLTVMMVYLTFFRNEKKADAKNTQKPAAAAVAAADSKAEPDCAEYTKAFVKTARTIRDSAVWENKGAPYVITGDLVIAKGAVFTIKPGVVIKMSGKDTDIIVKGRLVSKGTKAKPVIITSIRDDIAGDTNCDGDASKPEAGDYGKLLITGKATGVYEVRYAE